MGEDSFELIIYGEFINPSVTLIFKEKEMSKSSSEEIGKKIAIGSAVAVGSLMVLGSIGSLVTANPVPVAAALKTAGAMLGFVGAGASGGSRRNS